MPLEIGFESLKHLALFSSLFLICTRICSSSSVLLVPAAMTARTDGLTSLDPKAEINSSLCLLDALSQQQHKCKPCSILLTKFLLVTQNTVALNSGVAYCYEFPSMCSSQCHGHVGESVERVTEEQGDTI